MQHSPFIVFFHRCVCACYSSTKYAGELLSWFQNSFDLLTLQKKKDPIRAFYVLVTTYTAVSVLLSLYFENTCTELLCWWSISGTKDTMWPFHSGLLSFLTRCTTLPSGGPGGANCSV